MRHDFVGWTGILVLIGFFLASVAGYITHIIWLIDKAHETGSAVALLLVGMLVFPVGIVHGWSVWAGWYWI